MSQTSDNTNALTIPPNVRIGIGASVAGNPFRRFFSRRDPAIIIGDHSRVDGVSFALGVDGQLMIGECCHLSDATFLVEKCIIIGDNVVFGWNVVLADTDFHPMDPALRMKDAIALSPLGRRSQRPMIESNPIEIEDDVWIGPNVTVLKGVRIGVGTFVEPGAIVTGSVPPRSRVMGNPARVVGEVES